MKPTTRIWLWRMWRDRAGVRHVCVTQAVGDDWLAAFRLVRSGGRWRVGEARVFPVETGYGGKGEWSEGSRGVDAEAPRRGLTKEVLRLVQPHLWLRIGHEGVRGDLYSLGREFAAFFGTRRGPAPEKRSSNLGRPVLDGGLGACQVSCV